MTGMKLVAAFAFGLATTLAAAGAQAAQSPAGQYYTLTVSSSFKAPFKDCWAFSSNGRFIVDHAGLGSFGYQLTGLNSVAGHFQAVWEGRNSIGFNGTANGSTLQGDGVDCADRTYTYTGTRTASCANTTQHFPK